MCGNSVRDYDWIRTGLMSEPRGHDIMPGSVLYPPLRDAFIHKSIIGSLFYGRAEAAAGGFSAISPSITDQTWITGYNAIFSMAGILLLRASPFSRLIAADSAASMRAK